MQFEALNLWQNVAVWVLPVLLAITVHEWAHAISAHWFGDPTAKALGRISLNPVRHIDPIGTLLVPALLWIVGGFLFGWAKAVPVQPSHFKHPVRDMAWVALAGPFSNVVMAILWAGLAVLAQSYANAGVWVQWMVPLYYAGVAGVIINSILVVLNLLPLPPLDGSKILAAFLPTAWRRPYGRLEPWGFVILLALLLPGWLGEWLQPWIVDLQSGAFALWSVVF